MHKSRRVKITDLNPHIICVLCSGYLIEATTIIECLHSFCRTCLVKYLEHNKYCPICEVQVHKTKPLLNIRSDQTLQDIVYKLVPGLFQNEMCRRKDFYLKHPDQKPPDLEGRGEITQFSHIYTPDESISLSLEYYNNNENDNKIMDTKTQETGSRRYLRCPAAVSVAHLQKLIRAKYGLSNEHRVDILYKNDRLSEDFTLMDIAYIYLWRRKGPLHLTYRIFEVAKRIKLNDTVGNEEIKAEVLESDGTKEKNEWKEVQLQISENGVMSVTNIGETTKTPENFEVNLQKSKHVEPKMEKVEKTENTEITDAEKAKTSELGKHKLQEDATIEKSAKMMKPNNMANNSKTSLPAKNVQQLSRNHPLKIHSQSVNKNNIPVTKIQLNSILNVKTTQLKNQNTHVQSLNKTSVNKVVVKEEAAPATVQNIVTTQVQSTPNAKTIQNNPIIISSLENALSSSSSSISGLTGQNTLKYTQAGQSNSDNTRVTKSDDSIQNNNNQKTPISSSSVVSANNCIQSSKVGIVPKKSPVKIGSPLIYKTLRDPPKAWNPQISRQHLTKTTLHPANNNGASTSDQKQRAVETPSKPAKFFKMRNNVPRYLGNPASGVKPMYQVRDGDKTGSDANKKQPENKLNNNNDINKPNKPQSQPQPQAQEVELKAKIEIKKQTIVKIDPKTLRPILDNKPIVQDMASPSTSCADTSAPEIKINQSSVPIFNPLRNQKSQTSPKVDRRSPKTSSTATSTVPSSYMDPPKSCGKMTASSPTSKKDKLSLNFTPPNPFIPNLASPNLAPNQFLYPNFPSYDPRVMNNLTAYHPFSMYYSQPRLTYPGLSSQNLPLPPNLMSTLNLEVNKNLRKNYEMLQLNMENKKLTATCVKNDETNEKAENAEKNQEINHKNTKIPTKQTDQKQIVSNNGNNKDESRIKANEISNQLQKSNKEKEINAVCKNQAKEIPTETKEKEKNEVKVKVKDAKIEPPVPIKNVDKKDSKVELKNNEIVQKQNSEMKNVHVNDKKTEAVKTT